MNPAANTWGPRCPTLGHGVAGSHGALTPAGRGSGGFQLIHPSFFHGPGASGPTVWGGASSRVPISQPAASMHIASIAGATSSL